MVCGGSFFLGPAVLQAKLSPVGRARSRKLRVTVMFWGEDAESEQSPTRDVLKPQVASFLKQCTLRPTDWRCV